MTTTSSLQPAKEDQRPIICGTDFSEAAAQAVEVAAAIARRLSVKLHLVHVEEFRGLAMTEPTLFEAVISQNRQSLTRETERVRKEGTLVEERMLSGSVFEEVVTAAADSKARMIVIGAVGHGIGRRLLVGSVAERVAETSPIPTLVVRPGSPLLEWIRGQRPLKILAGYDFSVGSDAALRWVRELQLIGRCQLTVAHVDWPPAEAERLGYHGPMPLTENPGEIQNLLERDLSERIAMVMPPGDVSLSLLPGWGRTDAHLIQIAQAEKSDLIVVGTHGRHGLGRLRFGSVSRGVLRDAVTSVGVVAAPAIDRRKSRIPKIERVLVATDFSEDGNEAVRYACAILQRGGDLKLIHVVGRSGASTLAGKNTNPKLTSQLRAIVPESAPDRFEIDAEILASDNAGEAIAQEAERFGADVICLGSHGQGRLTQALMGSVAQGVMSRSRRPILLVRAQE